MKGMTHLAEELKKVKRITGMSSKQWGDKAGVSGATIDQICANNRSASATVLCQLASTSENNTSIEALMCAKIADELAEAMMSAPANEESSVINIKTYDDAIEKFALWGGLRQLNVGSVLGVPKLAVSIMEKAVKMGISVNRITMIQSDENPDQYSMDFTLAGSDSLDE